MSSTLASSVTSALNSLSSDSSGSSSTGTVASTQQLGENDFLTLLTTQMQNQDPLDPVDNTQMLAQLAQFSELSEIQGLSSQIATMVTATNSSTALSATELVGKQVSFNASQIGLTSGSTSTFQVVLPSATSDTTAVISDANGNVVRTLDLGPEPAGTTTVTWDGLNSDGSPCATGQYNLTVSGTGSNGSTVQGSTNVQATVTGVTYSNGVASLVVAGQQITLSQVTGVYDTSATN